MDCEGARVDGMKDLEKALTGLAARTGPLVIEARIDPHQYEVQF
jgi:acetolactate synthase I/II/III large subunit